MSSPGFRYSKTDFLSQWMPSSSRAGVILPQPDLAGHVRTTSTEGTPAFEELGECQSFISDFASLPATADSSCVSVEGLPKTPGGERTAGDRPLHTPGSDPILQKPNGWLASSDETDYPKDLPLIMKLDQLKKWQQHMQTQLKAQQLEELLLLQKEQQRLLGIMNGPEDYRADGLVSREERTAKHHVVSNNRPSSLSPSCKVPNSGSEPQEELQLSRARRHKWRESQQEEVISNSGDDSMEQSSGVTEDKSEVVANESAMWTDERNKGENSFSQDRPIKPGIGGQKKTFEDMLEEELRLEEQRRKTEQIQQIHDGDDAIPARPKRTFLRRGDGLSRFNSKTKACAEKTEAQRELNSPIQSRIICRSQSEPAAIQRFCTNGVQRITHQRNASTLKVSQRQGSSSPPQECGVDRKNVRTRVFTKQQTQMKESCRTAPDKHQQGGQQKEQSGRQTAQPGLTVGRSSHGTLPNPVTKQVVLLDEVRTVKHKAASEDGSMSGMLEKRSEPVGGEDDIQQESFEMSYQEKLQNWECDKQLENMELGEFELLEQAAEELSFSSNSSFVMKILQMDQHKRQDLPHRRLSSTPIKSSPLAEVQRRNSVGSLDAAPSVTKACQAEIRARVQQGEIPSEDERERAAAAEDNGTVSSCGSSAEKKQDLATLLPLSSQQPYDKRTYEDADSSRDSASDLSDGKDLDKDDVTLMEDNDNEEGKVVFDDDDTWNDMEDMAVCNSSDVSEVNFASREPSGGTLKHRTKVPRKVAVCKVVEFDSSVSRRDPDPAPASQLMTKLFPSLRPKTQTAAPAPPAPKPEDTNQQIQSRLLRERLVELELEIERFKKENASLSRLRQENEKLQNTLRKERLEFERTKADELARFEKYKEEESRKLQRDRRLFEKHASAARAIPDKKEREEIQMLKQQLSSLQEEVKKKESRWSSTHSCLRQQINTLTQETTSLKNEIQLQEKLRLSTIKKNSIDAERDGSSAAKGVKFASPLDSRAGSSSCSPPQCGAAIINRGSHRENSHPITGIKSSLRRPSSTLHSSSSAGLSSRRTEEKSVAARRSPDKSTRHCSPKGDTSEVERELGSQDLVVHPDGKTEQVLPGGDRLIVFPNGTKKEVSADGLTTTVTFFNGDTKQITADQRVIYYYADAQTTHVTYADGMEVLHFPNNQTEKHFPDGRKIITFPDQTVKNLFPDGREKSVLTDGTVINVSPDGTREIHFNTGQKEIHTADYKRREYPDGTVKTVFSDGRQDTRYPNGRVRVKDKDGNIILDVQQ
ncbi:centrosomal P4.1-associated protein [Neosynchiropus ocellatus]